MVYVQQNEKWGFTVRNEGDNQDGAGELRRRADELFLKKAASFPEDLANMRPEEIGRVLHELRVHQIELEMQNEELRRAQEELAASRERYFALYDLAPVGYITVSETGLILKTNLSARSLLGLVRDALINQPFSQFILKEDQDSYYWHRKQLFETGGSQSCELRMVNLGGTFFWAHLEVAAMKDTLDAPVSLIVISDITEKKKAEEALIELANAKFKFTATVSHELRSPLATIKEATNLVLEGMVGPVNEGQKDLLGTAKENIDRLGRLINNILFFQKMEAGKTEYELQPHDLNELIREAHRSALLLAGKRSADMVMDLENGLPVIKFDKDKILQVLINLLANAIKYSESGSIVIQTQREDHEIHVSVRDSGLGIKEVYLQAIFEPFSQVGDNQKGGTGLGLGISREIILAHHGRIWVESEEGKGSVFHFTLPI